MQQAEKESFELKRRQ